MNSDNETTSSYSPLHGDENCEDSCHVTSDCTKKQLETFLEIHDSGNTDTVSITDLKESIEVLKHSFNEHIGHPRFIAVLSTVCRWCLDESTISFGPDLGEKLRKYTALYRTS